MEHSTEKAAEWRLVSEIPGFEAFVGYRVSRDGRVESCRKRGSSRDTITGRWKPRKTVWGGGYQRVNLRGDTVSRLFSVHRLVLLAFGPPRPSGYLALHKDGNPSNNVIGNLYWGSFEDNEADKKRHGRTARGERNGNAKLTEDQVQEILRRAADGETLTRIAQDFGVSRTMIGYIRSGKSWAHSDPVEGQVRAGDFYRRKLTIEQVREIRQRSDGGEKDADLAQEFGVSRACIYLIRRGLNWKEDRPRLRET